MNDTAPWAAAKMQELCMARTPIERAAMAASMFDTARALQIAGLLHDSPGLSPAELRLKLLERTYRGDFTAERWERLLASWHRWEAARGRAAAVHS